MFETSPDSSSGEVSKALLQSLAQRIPPFLEDGTGLANIYSSLGSGANSAQQSRRGGAHNRADRESHAISTAQVANLKAAKCHATSIGLPLNRMITIHWEAAGVPLEGMAKATGKFVDLMTKALARKGSGTAWLWVHECGHKQGGHCHMLIHVPADLVPPIQQLQMSWLRRITDRPYKKRVIKSAPIGGRLGLEANNPELHAINLDVALGYVLKGAPQAVLDEHGFDQVHQSGGQIFGKRCSTSQNIGAKARKKDV